MATAPDQLTTTERLKNRYRQLSKIFFFIAIVYSIWIAVLIIGIYILNLGSKWAALTLDQWMYTAIGILTGMIILELLFILHYTITTRKKEKPQPVVVQGKHVHSFTIPVGAKGGLFSKTYVLIDEDNILHLRYQMIPPNDLWGKQQ